MQCAFKLDENLSEPFSINACMRLCLPYVNIYENEYKNEKFIFFNFQLISQLSSPNAHLGIAQFSFSESNCANVFRV